MSTPQTLLETLGLTEKEVRVFVALSELGKAPAYTISKKTKLARTTIYFILDSLIQKELVVEELKKNARYFSVPSLNVILKLVERERNELVAKENAGNQLVKLLAPLFNRRLFSIPSIQFFEGKKEVLKMCQQSLGDWHSSMSERDNIWWGFQDDSFVAEYKEFLESYWRMKNKDQQIKIFSNESQLEKQLKIRNRFIRPFPAGFSFESVFWVCGDYIIVIMHKNSPQYAFQLKDRVLAKNISSIFSMLWKFSAPQ